MDKNADFTAIMDGHQLVFLIKSISFLFPSDKLILGYSGFNSKQSSHGVLKGKLNQYKRTWMITVLLLMQPCTYRCWSGAFVCLSIVCPFIHYPLLPLLHSGSQTVMQSVPAVSRHRHGYTWDKKQLFTRTLTTNLDLTIFLSCMLLDSGYSNIIMHHFC